MSNFYVGQKVKTIRVEDTDDSCTFQGIPHGSDVELLERHDRYGTWKVVDGLGRHAFCKENRLVTIEPKQVLTEWQRKNLMRCKWLTDKLIMDDIESILSEPEPPKYQPKENEPVLFISGGCWWAGVFLGMADTLYLVAFGGNKWRYEMVFQFNAELIGKLTD